MAEVAAAGAVEKIRKGILNNAGSLVSNSLIEPEKK